MTRQKQAGAPEPKRRSRKGCWPCKARKVKCGEEHPACGNCLKTGVVCDYRIRLNWEGRRIKRTTPDDSKYGSPTASGKQIRWHHHEFPKENVQFSEYTSGSKQKIDTAGSTSHEQQWLSNPVSTTAQDRRPATTRPSMNGPTITKNLTFIDETLQFRSGVAKSEGHVAKKRLANSLDTSSASSSKRVTQLNSPALSHRHKTDKSFTKLEKLDMGFNLLLTCQTGQLGTTSPTTWIPCFDAAGRTDGPLTPATSSHSDEFIQKSNWVDFKSLGSPESWLSGNGESEDSSTQSGCLWEKPSVHGLQATLRNSTVYPREDGVLYGYDVGAADKDWLKSEDESANLLSTASDSSGHGVVNFGGEGISRRKHDRAGAVISHYYDSAVPVIIPWTFEPLPDILKRNQVNLMYFHHFLDHSAQVLVPYHDADTNPIGARIVQMALNNDALMSLILAYSASHRSQLLRADLPQMRMAEWAQSVFPALREPLVNEPAPVSDVALSMAVMLVALEIMSPGAFGQGISWREHITHARALFAKRLEHASKEPSGSNDDEGFKFIENWLGHVFVMGSLMAGPRLDSVCTPHVRFTLSDSYSCGEDSDEINCMTGISLKCASLLGRVAELTKQCQGERFRLDGRLLRGWSPEAAVTEQAILLEKQMMESFRQSSRPCSHVRMGNIHMQDLTEIAAINEAFHAAGLIHLHQRVLGSPVDHAEVQSQVQKIIQCLDQLRIGAAAEIRCLFPMFTAGCAAIDENQQAKILGRLMSAEKSGMKQIYFARLLLEQVWNTSCSWEELIFNEFIA